MRIPKNIYQTVKDKSNISSAFRDNIAYLRSQNQDWEYRIFDDKDIVEFISTTYGSQYLSVYLSINPIYGPAKADVFRYLLLYALGGVYLDIESTAMRPLNEIIKEDDEYLLSHWKNGKGEVYDRWGLYFDLPYPGEYQQWHVIAAPKHPFLRNVISHVKSRLEHYDALRDGVGWNAVIKTTGPYAYTKAILPIVGAHKHRIVDAHALGLRYSSLDPENEHYRLTGEHAHARHFADHYKNVEDPVVVDLGRNSPCPCGSGKKYKHCHGRLA